MVKEVQIVKKTTDWTGITVMFMLAAIMMVPSIMFMKRMTDAIEFMAYGGFDFEDDEDDMSPTGNTL